MRSLLSVVLGLSLVGCITGEIGDGGGGGGGGGGSGSGSGSNEEEEEIPMPRIDIVNDNPTVNTELGTTQMITINLVTTDFTGPVTLAASAINPTTMAPVPGWMATVAAPTVQIAGDGTTPVVVTLVIPTQNGGELTGAVKLDITSSIGTQTAMSTVTTLNQLTINVAASGTECAYPATNLTIKTGTKVRFLNKVGDDIIIHGDGFIPHQNVGTPSAPDAAYEVTFDDAGNGSWYCHSPGPNLNGGNPRVIVVQ